MTLKGKFREVACYTALVAGVGMVGYAVAQLPSNDSSKQAKLTETKINSGETPGAPELKNLVEVGKSKHDGLAWLFAGSMVISAASTFSRRR